MRNKSCNEEEDKDLLSAPSFSVSVLTGLFLETEYKLCRNVYFLMNANVYLNSYNMFSAREGSLNM